MLWTFTSIPPVAMAWAQCGKIMRLLWLAGLDFFFVTDHNSLRQKHLSGKWRNVSWGQEPGAGSHHIGILCNNKLFKPRRDNFAQDVKRAREISPFVFIPHPVGWCSHNWYTDDQIQALWTIGDTFAMEVMNGASKIVRGYDEFAQKAVIVWDKLLCAGKKVTALGGSDAHCPEGLGTVWTGIYSPRCDRDSLIRSLQTGCCFASEAPLLEFNCEGKRMGAIVCRKQGSIINLRFRAADAAGLTSVRIISEGRIAREYRLKGQTVFDRQLLCKVPARDVYYRLEAAAVDDRRAFSTPVYIKTL